MEKKMETTVMGSYRDYYEDPFLHSWLTKGKIMCYLAQQSLACRKMERLFYGIS